MQSKTKIFQFFSVTWNLLNIFRKYSQLIIIVSSRVVGLSSLHKMKFWITFFLLLLCSLTLLVALLLSRSQSQAQDKVRNMQKYFILAFVSSTSFLKCFPSSSWSKYFFSAREISLRETKRQYESIQTSITALTWYTFNKQARKLAVRCRGWLTHKSSKQVKRAYEKKKCWNRYLFWNTE